MSFWLFLQRVFFQRNNDCLNASFFGCFNQCKKHINCSSFWVDRILNLIVLWQIISCNGIISCKGFKWMKWDWQSLIWERSEFIHWAKERKIEAWAWANFPLAIISLSQKAKPNNSIFEKQRFLKRGSIWILRNSKALRRHCPLSIDVHTKFKYKWLGK